MAQRLDLAELFSSIAQELDTDRSYLNGLDGRNRNAGDNMAQNFRIVSDVLAQLRGQGDDRDALMTAAQTLRQQGRGKTASLYASGLEQAASNLPSGSLSFDQLLPLLEGLLGGVQGASGAKQGDGTLLDALIPGVLGYMQAKRRGASDMEAILDALAASRRGTYGGYGQQPGGGFPFPQMPQQPQQPNPYGQQPGGGSFGGGQAPQQPQIPQQPSMPPQPDPGAAGVGSLLEGLFRGLLRGGFGGGGGSDSSEGDNQPPGGGRFQPREPKAWA